MAKFRILVVDDEESICHFCVDGLQSAGYAVEMSTDASQALNLACEYSFDVILTDLRMPGLGGFDFLRSLMDHSPSAAIIFMTGFATVELAAQAVRGGAYAFLQKPFTLDDLRRTVEQVLQQRRKLHKAIRSDAVKHLFEVSQKISTTSNPQEWFAVLMESILRETGADQGHIYRVDEHSSECSLQFASQVPHDSIVSSLSHRGTPTVVSTAAMPLTESLPATPALHLSVPLKSKSKLKGVLELKKRRGGTFSEADRKVASIMAAQATMAFENAELEREREDLVLEFVKSLAAALDERDTCTSGHSQRVSRLAAHLGRELNLDAEQLACLELAANLHDIGKIGVRDEILLKPSKLTPEEYEIIKSHSERGYRILRPIRRLGPVAEAVHAHHEWHNGKGYPRGLRGEEIPLLGAIISVADAFDAMVSNRPYRPQRSAQVALQLIVKAAGTQFRPAVVEALLRLDPALLDAL